MSRRLLAVPMERSTRALGRNAFLLPAEHLFLLPLRGRVASTGAFARRVRSSRAVDEWSDAGGLMQEKDCGVGVFLIFSFFLPVCSLVLHSFFNITLSSFHKHHASASPRGGRGCRQRSCGVVSCTFSVIGAGRGSLKGRLAARMMELRSEKRRNTFTTTSSSPRPSLPSSSLTAT